MVDLSDGQREFLELANKVDRVKGYSNVVEFFGSKKEFKRGIDDLEEKGLVERVTYGVWKVTKKGASVTTGRVSCTDCGREFESLEAAMRNPAVMCGHESLNQSIRNFL